MWEGVKNYEGTVGFFLSITAGERCKESEILIMIIKGKAAAQSLNKFHVCSDLLELGCGNLHRSREKQRCWNKMKTGKHPIY